MRDLAALSALPAMWKGFEPCRIAESAASTLVSMLDAEFVYVGLRGESDDNEIDVVKTAEPVEATRLREIAAAVKLEIRDAGGREAMTIADPCFRGAFRLAVAPIGFDGIGVIAAGAQAGGFPTETQRLLLIAAANKGALGLLRWQSETEMRRFLEHQRLESRLREAHLELGHATRLSSAGQIAAALAHELNQPLTAIANSLGAAKRLLARGSFIGIDSATEAMDEAVQQSLRAAQVVSRLRNFLIRGETETRCENIAAMVDEARALALIGPTASGVEIRILLDPEAPHIVANRIEIQQVLINLMRNAVEAMAGMDQRKLRVTTRLRRPDLVEFAVADSGAGIGAAIAERIFEPFVTTKCGGMGIGLSICRSIVETHGGRLQFEPNPEGGTIFRFTLPAVSG
ncbi:MAG TPA: ATP-binding protein [Roseiarcus sp.]